MDLEAEGTTLYELTVKAGDQEDSGVKGPVLLIPLGSKGQGQTALLTDKGLKPGEAVTAKVKGSDIGNITGYRMSIPEPGKFRPTFVRIKNMGISLLIFSY
jgi:hypothetical protein